MYTNRINIHLNIEFETGQKVSRARLLEMLDHLTTTVTFEEVKSALVRELMEQEDLVSWKCSVPKAKASDVASRKED